MAVKLSIKDLMKTYYGAKGLAWLKCKDGKLDGGISKFFSDDIQNSMMNLEWTEIRMLGGINIAWLS
mgnify:CR=1 FL=1